MIVFYQEVEYNIFVIMGLGLWCLIFSFLYIVLSFSLSELSLSLSLSQLELEKSEARKLMKLRDDRISQLDATCRAMSENMMSQSVRHENEMSKLRESETDALRRLNELLVENNGEDAELVSSAANYENAADGSSSPSNGYHHNKVHGNVSIRGGGSGAGGEQKNDRRDHGLVPHTPTNQTTKKDEKKSSGSGFFGRLRFF